MEVPDELLLCSARLLLGHFHPAGGDDEEGVSDGALGGGGGVRNMAEKASALLDNQTEPCYPSSITDW